MKVIFSHALPFFLAHGGMQTLIESLERELIKLGVEVEPERWWDESQQGDILHYFLRPPIHNIRLAHEKGFKVVMTDLLDQTASRSRLQLFSQRSLICLSRRLLGPLTERLGWDAYHEVDALVYGVPHELEVARYLFEANSRISRIIPLGLDAEAIAALAQPQGSGDYLVSVSTIHPRKNNILLARAAKEAQVPVLFLGKPYSENHPYYQEFLRLVDGRFVRYPGYVSKEEKHRCLRGARGFVLLSQYESGCVSLLEAAAAGLPLFLSDLPWASRVYRGEFIQYTRLDSFSKVVKKLRTFYTAAQRQSKPTHEVFSWSQAAQQYIQVYRQMLGHSSP